MIRDTATGVELADRVIPRARTTALAGLRDGVPLVRLAAPPVDDAANRALIGFFAELFGRPRRDVRLVGGERGRLKRLEITGVSIDEVRRVLGEDAQSTR